MDSMYQNKITELNVLNLIKHENEKIHYFFLPKSNGVLNLKWSYLVYQSLRGISFFYSPKFFTKIFFYNI